MDGPVSPLAQRPRRRASVESRWATRAELVGTISRLEDRLTTCCRTLDIQFQRIAELQADVDRLRWARDGGPTRTTSRRIGVTTS
jgi:hypothetical protein